MTDPFAHLNENRWREVAEIDDRLERGEIDEQQWHRELAHLVVPAYLAADTPWGQSGKSGDDEDWESARSLIAAAVDRDGSFLDVGCARSERTTEQLLRRLGFHPAGGAQRLHPEKQGMEYGIVWVDA